MMDPAAPKSAVLAAELRRAVAADREADAGDVSRLGQEPRPRFVQADLLLELDRCHRADRAELAPAALPARKENGLRGLAAPSEEISREVDHRRVDGAGAARAAASSPSFF
jgi:hypothetical protein